MGLFDVVGSLLGGEGQGNGGGGLDLSSVVNLVSQLASSGEAESGSAHGTVHPQVLAQKVAELAAEPKTEKPKEKATTHKATTSAGGKKIVDAAPVQQAAPAAQQSGGGIDLSQIMGIVQNLAGGSHEHTGAPEGQINPNMLGGILSALTGGSNASGTPNVDHGSIVNLLAPLLSGNDGLMSNFKENPIELVEKVVGIKFDASSIGPILEGVMGALGGKK